MTVLSRIQLYQHSGIVSERLVGIPTADPDLLSDTLLHLTKPNSFHSLRREYVGVKARGLLSRPTKQHSHKCHTTHTHKTLSISTENIRCFTINADLACAGHTAARVGPLPPLRFLLSSRAPPDPPSTLRYTTGRVQNCDTRTEACPFP